MGIYNFTLEVVVPSVNLRKTVIQDPKDLKVEIGSRFAQFSLTSSRLNLTTFCGDNVVKCEADSETIGDDLKSNPLKVTVKLKEQIVGIGEIPWPKKFVDRIVENMEVITEGANTELKMDDKVVGCVEVILRIQGCCNICQLEEETQETENEDNEILPGDIMFLMDDGEGCKKKESEEPEDPCPNRLNFSNFRGSNGKIIVSPEFQNACTSPQCIALKKMGGNLEQVVKSLVCSGLQDVRANKKPKCCNPCELKLDPCTGKYVCPEESCCTFCQKDKLTAPCYLKTTPNACCTPQERALKPPCIPISVGSSNNANMSPWSSSLVKCGHCPPCSPQINTCLLCKKFEYLPSKWPNISHVEYRCKSIMPRPPKSTKCCRICQELITCTNRKKSCDEIQFKPTVVEPKYCRICNTDISWLPKHCSCPTCGDKHKSCLQQEYKKTLKMIRQFMENDRPKC